MTTDVVVPMGSNGKPMFELPRELAVDTDVARRVMVEFIRSQLRPGPHDRLEILVGASLPHCEEEVGPTLTCVSRGR